jgi:pilus assembly protein CpaB
VQPQETLEWTDLAIAADDRRDLSSLVAPGMRAVTVRARSGGNDRANELIRPGDRVDVIVTSGERDQQTTVVLLQNVLVLAVGLDTGGDGVEKHAGGIRDSLLTLSLSIREAQLEAMAAEKGRISVALRNPDDVRVVDGLPQLTGSALLEQRIARAPTPSGQDAGAGAPVKLERAEVQRGGRR